MFEHFLYVARKSCVFNRSQTDKTRFYKYDAIFKLMKCFGKVNVTIIQFFIERCFKGSRKGLKDHSNSKTTPWDIGR